jgi:hypothetical protein
LTEDDLALESGLCESCHDKKEACRADEVAKRNAAAALIQSIMGKNLRADETVAAMKAAGFHVVLV